MQPDLSQQLWTWVGRTVSLPLWLSYVLAVSLLLTLGMAVHARHRLRIFRMLRWSVAVSALTCAIALFVPGCLLLPMLRDQALGLHLDRANAAAITSSTLPFVASLVNIALFGGICGEFMLVMSGLLLYSPPWETTSVPAVSDTASQTETTIASSPPIKPVLAVDIFDETSYVSRSRDDMHIDAPDPILAEATAFVSRADADTLNAPHIVVVRSAEQQGAVYPIEGELTIGRIKDCAIWLDEKHVSRVHAHIIETPTGLQIEPQGQNGTWLNGQLQEANQLVALHDADRVSLGFALLRLVVPDVEKTQYTLIPQARRALLVPIDWDNQPCDWIFPICNRSITIGRAPNCDLVLKSQRVSKLHVRIDFDSLNYTLMDCGSQNRALVDKHPVTRPHRLNHGQVIALGDQRLRFEFEDGPV